MSAADAGHERAIRDAVLAGGSGAWRAWFDAHYEPLARYARWRCGGLPDLADDVIQETWLTAVRRVRDFDPAKGAFFDWLCGIASNAARSAARFEYRHITRPMYPLNCMWFAVAGSSNRSDQETATCTHSMWWPGRGIRSTVTNGCAGS